MAHVTIRERGQLTIPASLRKELKLEEQATMTIVKVGHILLLTPHTLVGETVARKASQLMKRKGLRLADVLTDLKKQRERYNRERDGG